MRNLTIRDLLATVVTAATLVPFVGYSVRGSMPFIQDPRGMAGVGIVGVLVVAAAFGFAAFRDPRIGLIMALLGMISLGFGIAALIAETSWVLLVPMAAGLAAFWAVGVLSDATVVHHPRALRHG